MDVLGPELLVAINLTDVCRACLTKSIHMISFYPKTDGTSELIAMMSSVGNFEVDISEALPSYLCRNCEEKLRLSYNFQQQLQRSHEIIRQCLEVGKQCLQVDDEDAEVEIKFESEAIVKTSQLEQVGKQCLQVDDEDAEVEIKFESDIVKTRQGEQCKLQATRLAQFSSNEVEEAIAESRRHLFRKRSCIKCGFITTNIRALTVHINHLHPEIKDRWCYICNLEVDGLEEHQNTHKTSRLKCEFCGKVFQGRGHFIEHLRSHSRDRPFKCQYCPKGFVSLRHLKCHLKIHSTGNSFKCNMCSKRFKLKKSLKKHLEECHITNETVEDVNMPQNFCIECKKRVRSLTVHRGKYHNEAGKQSEKDQVLCTDCGKQFKTASKLRIHMRIHTGELPYKCLYCEKRTSSRNQLVVHQRIHTGEKPHICTICGKGFAQSSVLNTHMRIHTGKPEVCEICGKRFCRSTQLRLHMRKHTGERPFLCPECGQTFKQRSHLMDHLKTHSDERPFKCSYCVKAFRQASALKSHMHIHLGSKPFKCSQCPYACRQSHSLKQHMKQHSADLVSLSKNPQSCHVCQKVFGSVMSLNLHSRTVHPTV